eukprot:gene104-138_t
MSSLRVLYVASEIAPFLHTSNVGTFVGKLAPTMQQGNNVDIRILVPRFGVISERKNKLHEVVRLSGISIPIGHQTHNLSVKVTAIPGTRIQVYFIDNETYFHRKFIFHDKDNHFYEDNDERLIFICKGVLETVKNLNWIPNVVHCHDWITSLIPLYLKTSLQHDAVFQHTKVLFNLYNTQFPGKFDTTFASKATMEGMPEDAIQQLASVGFSELMKIGSQYADVAIQSEPLQDTPLATLCTDMNIPYINNDVAGIQEYLRIYQQLIS